MNENYRIEDILIFLRNQMKTNFVLLEAVVNLLEYPSIEPEDKKKAIIELFRKYGLFEIGYEGDKNDVIVEPEKHEKDLSENVNDDIIWDEEIEVPIEIFIIQLGKATLTFENILN